MARRKATRRRSSYKAAAPRRRRSRRGLSDPGGMKSGILGLALGAVAGQFVIKTAKGQSQLTDKPIIVALIPVALGFMVNRFMKQPAIGDGMIAAGVIEGAREGLGLKQGAEEVSYVSVDALSDAYSLSDEYSLSEGDGMGADPNFNQVYPAYVNPGFYDDYEEVM